MILVFDNKIIQNENFMRRNDILPTEIRKFFRFYNKTNKFLQEENQQKFIQVSY